VLPTDSQFEFEISAENLNPTDLGLLSIGLNELVSGDFQVGGKTTRGLGNCKLIDMVIYISDWENPDQFKKFILGNTRETKYAVKSQADAKQFLLEKINNLF
jgi:CRISPR/Cas system CSM-associated protein Csm3 (group 7 of RAMP superfamily)